MGDVEQPLLDLVDLNIEATNRYDHMKANPDRRGDPDFTYSKHVIDEYKALSDKLREDAVTWVAKSDASNIGAIARKKLLAQRVLDEKYDA